MPKVRIKLQSSDIEQLNNVCETINDIAKQAGINISGPIPLPTKRLKVTTRKSPCGDGKASFDSAKLMENYNSLINAIKKAKPAGAKGQYFRNISISSSMGPGIRVELPKL